jgi:thiol-disulfide isomerase/thioredoxin
MKSSICIGITLLFWGCFSKAPEFETGYEGKLMPAINLLLLDSSTNINTKISSPGKALVLIDISPFCPYCRALTQSITDNNKDLSDIQFVLLSNYSISDLKKYYNEYHLEKYANIMVGQDYENYFESYYKTPGVPCTAIYGKDRRLKRMFMGKVSSKLIKDIVME